MTKERQKKRKRLRALQPPPPEPDYTPKFGPMAEQIDQRAQQLFGPKEQWSREERQIAFAQLVAEGVINPVDFF
jgi:hypothetical protein